MPEFAGAILLASFSNKINLEKVYTRVSVVIALARIGSPVQ